MVFCTYCGHSFTRDEHLERHILTRMQLSARRPESLSADPDRHKRKTFQVFHLPYVVRSPVCHLRVLICRLPS